MQELIEFKMPSHLLYVSSILAFARRLAQQIGFSPDTHERHYIGS